MLLLKIKGKYETVEKYADKEKLMLLINSYTIENSFNKDFIIQLIESTYADIYENFLENGCEYNYFYWNFKKLNENTVKKFYKIMGIYHVLQAIKKHGETFDEFDLEDDFFETYDLNECEIRLYSLLKVCLNDFNYRFPHLFSVILAKYLFDDEVINLFQLAFIENFCYNSYKSFMASFNRYIPLKIRAKSCYKKGDYFDETGDMDRRAVCRDNGGEERCACFGSCRVGQNGSAC